MIDILDLRDVCSMCAFKVNQFAIDKICLDCWKGMHNGR